MFESDSVVSDIRKRKHTVYSNSVSGKPARSLTLMRATVSQLKEEADKLTAYRTQVEAEESWARESFFQLESLHYYMKAERVNSTKKARLDSDTEVTGPHLLLEVGSCVCQVEQESESLWIAE